MSLAMRRALAADPETELMLRVASGDDDAFVQLVERMVGRLHGFFRRMGADRAFAEDCAQEVFLKVYRRRAHYTARARFTTYLFHVARNHWIDVYRHRKAVPPPLSTDAIRDADGRSLTGDLPDRPIEAIQGVRDREIREALGRALETLTTEQRDVYVLAQVEGLKYQEIGEILEVPVGTVKSRMHAAIRALRHRLSEMGIEPS